MILKNLELLPTCRSVDIGFRGSEITSVDASGQIHKEDPFVVNFEDAIAFPGLINSHDHLDFNLFPALGDPPYKNYTDWGDSIQKLYKKNIDEVLFIPSPLRVRCGMYKNLLCGVTTVVDHGPRFLIENPLIDVISNHQSLHSVRFEKLWKLKLNNPFRKNTPCVIHIGEGIDQESKDEIDTLIKWNLLKRPLYGVHGVAMDVKQALEFKGLIWCPASNYFLFNTTARVDQLKNNTSVCLGTDSTLTANWNIWEHVRLAKGTGYVTNSELYQMLTEGPALLWGLDRGCITPGTKADMVIANKRRQGSGLEAFMSISPRDILMVVQNGEIRLFDNTLLDQLSSCGLSLSGYSPIKISGVNKYVQGDLKGLVNEVKKYNSSVQFPFEII